ncbi:leucine-rich repeat domain-containing protein [Roseiconus nitratireducens]|uniref:leucine-rich repeat domain-containing protein n=1 Tax=Roseiconus nitratireducens TaxID=2605748 RepID=UPI001375AB31|nr:hypothetical protein [Roseiconus nitratireducens]
MAFTVIGIWFAYVSSRARSQKAAIDEVTRLGGFLGFDYHFDASMRWRNDPKLPAPVWLIDLLGEDCARSVWIVNFDEGSDPTNDDLKVVERFTRLKQLTLMNRKKISDEGLRHVAGLTELEVLAISGTNVTGEGLSNLRNCTKLKGLPMNGTPLNNLGLSHVSHLKNLEWLQLSGTQITDEGLRHLSGLSNLESLELADTAVTDQGLRHLSKLTSLKKLLLRGTQTTDEGRAWLQAELPNCSIAD